MEKVSNFGIFTLLFVSSLTIMVGTVIAPSLLGIVKQLSFGYSPSWLITLPSLGVVVFAPLVGKWLNRWGTFKLLILGLIPYGILGVAGAYITNDVLLIVDRFLLGGATVVVQVSVTAFIAELFTGETRMKMIAWQGMSIEFGGVVFLALGGILSEIHWQFPFYIYLVALACLLLVIKTLPKNSDGLLQEEVKDSSKKEDKAKINIIFYASLLSMMLFFVGFVTLPLYLPESFSFTESQTGYYMAFISVMAIVTASQMPKMVKFLGDGKTVTFGFVFFTLSFLVLSSTGNQGLLILAAVFMGIGFGFTIPLLNHMMIETSTLKNQGKNLGLFSMGVFGGQFLSTFIQYISNDYKAIYSVTTILALSIGGLLFYLFKKLDRSNTSV